ncbi:NAD(P)H-dependent oxidoreductase, partial [Sansalvadorimonas verongulae]|uniref:NAD(P)H-dependent oxidoreductase n=1 Tax=Sansalvadorimonas verongulae TaxID=2172824 RepID=UPI0018AD2CF4
MSKVVVISGHPDLERSYTNTIILDELQKKADDIEVHKLDELYPDYQINVEAEQKALLEADAIVLQFPYYWYSVPALMKKWIDDVFSFNFAYGPEGDKLKGKHFILSLTVGGPEESYDPLGYNHFTIEETLRPLQQTAYLAGMVFQKPVYSHGMVYIPGVYNKLEDVQEKARF